MHIHGGHYLSRQHLATRYEDMNCHAITSHENHHQSMGDRDIIYKYDDFMIRKYGKAAVDDLIDRSRKTANIDWVDKATELYDKAIRIDKDATDERLGMVYRTILEKKTLELILLKIGEQKNG